ncbi:hypothetical protein SB6095_05259 [Klebsiella quasivariicola]|uniref:hypothetical protein n=1 Tax=Klebsiella pneumoniae complex TaxID=3390273 RepID=UPI0007CC3B43|nr:MULTISPECIES: hypothetical protein [Klebsiella]MBE8939724.1 hypothetical protein [Escherichia coli]DAP14663.1 MAG TPA: hypothetical protein [Caudoviricetes sp.]HBY0608546.1 hypothetical protein [Klebsiella pneumoniae subsp. pneumoniae]HDG8063203.1 hypothetical protein [Klebsiella quasipneumoniae subsp. similipneumoniae]HDS8579119.1 hypothetical protein [Klebsiella variicola]
MKKAKMLASITADTSRIESKMSALLEVLPEHVTDEVLCILSRLTNEIILVNGPVAIAADGSFNIVHVMDFDSTAYNEVMSAARAFKFNLAH